MWVSAGLQCLWPVWRVLPCGKASL